MQTVSAHANLCKTEPASLEKAKRFLPMNAKGPDPLRVSFSVRIACSHLSVNRQLRCYSRKSKRLRERNEQQSASSEEQRVITESGATVTVLKTLNISSFGKKTRTLPQKIHSLIIREVALYRDGGNRVT